ncbi:MAG: hypothetical protein SWQ30_04555 [Thermodesulfobacteriota bacterium]|nr:hypothetical protein [Thermodesulfobacteriota bacterium]
MSDKKADLAGPGIGDYAELERILPQDYSSLLSPRDTQNAIYAVKDYIEENLCKELNLIRVSVPPTVGSVGRYRWLWRKRNEEGIEYVRQEGRPGRAGHWRLC